MGLRSRHPPPENPGYAYDAAPSTTLPGSTNSYPFPTTDFLEMKVCRDQDRNNEDIAFVMFIE